MRRSIRPLLVAQFFGAFNDNAWKLLVIVLTGRILGGGEAAAQAQARDAFVVFTLPLILFSLPAAVLGDRLSKRTIIVAMKVLEVLLMATGAVLLAALPGHRLPLLLVLGGMGLQSALFAPAKYGIVPELVRNEQLSSANGLLSLWTMIAIIAGTACGAPMLTASGEHTWLAAVGFTLLGAVGLGAALRIPRVPAAGARESPLATIRGAWRAIRANRPLWLTVVGLTFFWAVVSLLGQNLLVYARAVLGLDEAYTGVPLAVYGLGLGAGSWLAGRLSKGQVETGLIPLGAFWLVVGSLLLGLLAPGLFVTLLLLGLLGIASGFVVVPLVSLLQWRAPADRRGAVIAVSAFFEFSGTLAGSLLGGWLADSGLSTPAIFVGAAALTAGGTIWALYLLPDTFLRLCIYLFTNTVYRLDVVGREHVPDEGGVLLTPNHVSFVDGLLVIGSLPRPVRFLVDEDQFNRPWLKPLLRLLGAIPISSGAGMRQILRALRDAGQYLDDGEVVCIFPEGQITRTGQMNPFRRGLERIVKGRSAPIVPVHLDRVWGSIFSFSGGRFVTKLPEGLPYPVTVSFGEPLAPGTPLPEVKQAVQALGAQAWPRREASRPPLHRSFIRAMRRRRWKLALADATRPRVSRLAALTGAIALARALRPHWKGEERAGVLLPPSVAGALVNVAALLGGRPVVNLNYTAGPAGMASAARQAGLTRVVTSRAFLEKAKLELPAGVAPVFVEDLRPGKAFAALLALLAPARWIERACGARRRTAVSDDATIIFSSGSTGEPKGVRLTHFNLDSNAEAVAQVFRPEPADRLLGILPLFHSFGTLSMWFALDHGMPIVFTPNPVDAPEVGRLVLRYRLTFLLGTPTFLGIYLRRCTPEQFGSLRLVMAGAERLPEELADAFEDRFGIRPIQGYGTTECSPVVAASIPPFRAPGFFQAGSKRGFVGPPIPGVTVRVVDPDTFETLPANTPGMLLVRGPNVMRGYLGHDDLTAQVMVDGWYVTGDIALVDEDGYIRITDRLSRFAKIGGEMVPHGAVEEALHKAHGEAGVFAVTSVPDPRKGEQLAVLHTTDEENIAAVLEKLAQQGLPNLYVPRRDHFVKVDAIPLLGTGKTDLRAVRKIAREALDAG